MKESVIINKRDSVEVILRGGADIPMGHKRALRDIKKGEYVIKYGEIIGVATKDIKKGEHVHSHNLRTHLTEEDREYIYEYGGAIKSSVDENAFFLGYKREGRRAGIRNDIYIIPTVGCVNGVCKRLENVANTLKKEGVDGIFALTHQFGCSQLGEDAENITKFLASAALNPNASFVLFVGLGCENNSLELIKKELGQTSHIAFLKASEYNDEYEEGLNILKDFIERASLLKRERIPFGELCIGLKCGGSDGLSGITANPLVGRIAERAVKAGASTILTEIPETFGAERLLMKRCKDEQVFEKFKDTVVNFKEYYTSLNFPVYENPSPGNKLGGITTLEEKSLGCVEKGGKCEITDVLEYGERVKERGLSILNAPGNDLVAASALAAAGCQLVLFTTGRGTPFSTFVPTLKIASSDDLSDRKANWIDFNAFSMDENGLYSLVINTANGEYCEKSRDLREIAFFKKGVTL